MAESPDEIRNAPPAVDDDTESALMARNSITRVRADQYHVDGYRYSRLADAMAQVGRAAGGRRAAS
jgi:hypothetical protein